MMARLLDSLPIPAATRLLLTSFIALSATVAWPAWAQNDAKPRVLFVGIDGASNKIIAPLIEKGHLPGFERLTKNGASQTDFDTLVGGASPLIWTTMATGRKPEDHGITSFVTEVRPGVRVPVTSSSRKARAIWEIASDRGTTVGVIGYWATWPAEEIAGYVITDHANSAFSEFMFADGRLWSGADPARLSQLKRDFYPLEIGPTLAEHWISSDQFPYDDMQRRGGFTDTQLEIFKQTPWNIFDQYYSLLKTMYRVDYPLFEVTKDLMKKVPTDLVMLYLHGPDPIQHLAWDLAEPEAYAVPNPHLERDRGLVKGVYRAMDSMLVELLDAVGPETWVMVVSDHGIEPSPLATGDPREGRPGEHPYSAKGVFYLAGPSVKKGFQITGATPYEVMPTLCWLLDLPIADEFEGRILAEAFEPEFVQKKGIRRVASYGPRTTSAPQRSPADQLMVDLLKGLGYVGN